MRGIVGRLLSSSLRWRPHTQSSYDALPLDCRLMSSASEARSDEFVDINWKKLKDGSGLTTKCRVGENIMRAAHATDIEIEGACEGVCACSTCHVILEDNVFDSLPVASEREEDMLDQGTIKHTFNKILLSLHIILSYRRHHILLVTPIIFIAYETYPSLWFDFFVTFGLPSGS